MTNRYDLGDMPRIEANFTSGTFACDPTTVTLKIKPPSGVIETISSGQLTNPSMGTWYYDKEVDEVGQWWYRFEGDGIIVATEEAYFIVDPSEFD